MTRSTKIRFYCAAVLLLAGCCVAAFAQAPNRLTRFIDESEVRTLMGNTHSMARPEFDQGTVGADQRLERMVLQLQPSVAQQAELEALLAAQHDPQSPLYHQWLTPTQFGARFGVGAADLAKVTAWLTGHGFTIDEIPAGNRSIVFSGTAGQVAETFHTEIHRYQVKGAAHIANAQDPQIPAALAEVVGGVVSLHDFRRNSAIHSQTRLAALPDGGPKAQYTSGSSHYLLPADWAKIYDLTPLYSAGTSGAGVSIAIVGRSDISLTDVANFRSTAALSANPPTVILVNGDPGLVSGDQMESTLDVEWAGAIAPQATLKFVVGKSTGTTDGIDLSAQYIVNNKTASVMSTSYGSCEADMGASENAFYNNLWQQAASEGISSFVSSGDSGAAGCNAGSDTTGSGAGVNGLCSSPYATCVGGTEFNEGSNPSQYWAASNGSGYESALGYIPEIVWNESKSNGGSGLWASGGGVSILYGQPTWQAGVSGIAAANGKRAVPDVAMTAAGHDGYLVVESGSTWVVSGTSAASPTFAALMALVVQSQKGAGLGNANTGLYPLVNATKNPFHPTPTGNNTVPGVTGFSATGAAYNPATGLGSVDGATLVSAWGSGSSKATDFSLALSSSSATVAVGKSTTFTVNVTESGTAKNAISLTASALTGATITVNPSSITPGTNATVTVTIPTGSTLTTGVITITGSDSSGSQKAAWTLTVTQPPTLTLTPVSTSNTLTLSQGTSGSLGYTVATGGSYTGSITLSTSTLPAGVTAQWTATPITGVSGVSSTAETLTLTASATAAVTSAAVTVTAAGDNLTAAQPVTLKVLAATPTLTVTPASNSLSVLQGASVTDSFGFSGNAVYNGPITLSVSGLPSGVTASWSVSPLTLSNEAGTSVLTLKATAAAPPAGATITVTAVGDNLTVKKQITLQVLQAPSISAALLPTSVSMPSTGSASSTVTITPAGGLTITAAQDALGIGLSGVPNGVSIRWNNPTISSAGVVTVTMTLTGSSAAVAGAYNIGMSVVIQNRAGTQYPTTASLPVTLTLPPALTLAQPASSIAVTRGNSAKSVFSLSGNATYSGPVTLAVNGLPSGVTAAWSASPVTLVSQAGSSTLTLTASSSAAVGSTTITVTATGDGLTVSRQITLQVQAAPSLQLTSSAATLTMAHAASGSITLTSTPLAGLSAPVSLSVSGLPAGVTAAFSTQNVAAPGSGSVKLTFTGSSAAKAGTTSVTVTAKAAATAATAALTTTQQVSLILQ
jgi:uncharacterized membrane protein